MKGRRQTQSGHAMLELSVTAGIVLAFIGWTFQFGYAFYIYNQLVTAVGNGARYASTRTLRAATDGDVEKVKTAIRNMVVYGDSQPDKDATPVVANLSPDKIQINYVKDSAGNPVKVNLTLANYKVDAVFQTYDFSGRPFVEFPFTGRYAPTEKEP